jgi:hypothetical protein
MGKFLYPTGLSSGYSGIASFLAGRIATVTGFSGMPAPPSPTGNDGFLQAMADGLVGIVTNPYCAAIYNTTAGQSIPSGASTVVNFDTLELDSDGAVATGAGWTFTCPTGKGGLYHVSAVCGFASFNVAAIVFGGIFQNSTEKHRSNRWLTAAADSVPYVTLSADLLLSAGDTVQFKIFQGAGVNKTLELLAASNRICIHRVLGS